jgi:hypothetical protein
VVALVLNGAALILNATVLTLRSGLRPALLIGGLPAVIGLSLAPLFAIGTPWPGPITVSGQPIDAVAKDLNAGYFHPGLGPLSDKLLLAWDHPLSFVHARSTIVPRCVNSATALVPGGIGAASVMPPVSTIQPGSSASPRSPRLLAASAKA